MVCIIQKYLIILLSVLVVLTLFCGNNSFEIEDYTWTIRKNPNAADKQFNLGVAYSITGRHKEAVKAFKQAVRLNPEDADAYFRLGHAYLEIERPKNAVNAFKKAFQIKPIKAVPSKIGKAYYVLGCYQDAIEAYKEAVRIDEPHPVWNLLYLGMSYSNLNRFHEAIETFKVAFKINKDAYYFYEVWFELGFALQKLGRYKESLEAYKHVVRIKADFANVYYYMGLLYIDVNNKKSAIEQYETLKILNVRLANKLFEIINN